MKLFELQDIINNHIDRREGLSQTHDLNREVLVAIAKPGMGARRGAKVKDVQFGFDWEANQFRITTEEPLVPKTNKEEIYDMAHDLIMFLATKPCKRESYEIRTARRILTKAGVDYMKFQHLFHEVDKSPKWGKGEKVIKL